jgi:hypothetical protein
MNFLQDHFGRNCLEDGGVRQLNTKQQRAQHKQIAEQFNEKSRNLSLLGRYLKKHL